MTEIDPLQAILEQDWTTLSPKERADAVAQVLSACGLGVIDCTEALQTILTIKPEILKSD